LYVDFVASAIGAEVNCDEWGIDIGLLGTQKVLSLPPDLGIIAVSKKAMAIVEEINYAGYDAILPFKNAVKEKYMPYTHNWRAIAALNYRCKYLLNIGIEKSIKNHKEVSSFCIKRIKEMNLKLFVKDENASSPTVTAVYVPENWSWEELNKELKSKGVCFGGSYGELSGKIFRIGHLGTQSDLRLVSGALDVLEEILKSK
jgi:aspartate aminotransferase-like enzyme